MENFWPIFWSAIGTALTGLLTWLTLTITNFFNGKIKDKKMAAHATALLQIVMSAVKSVSQSFVDTLKKNGKFDEEAQKEAKERAMVIVKSELTVELKEYIVNNFGDIESYISNQIEAALYNLKK